MSYILNALKKAENKSFDDENIKVKKQILILKRQTRGGKLKIFFIISGLLGTLLLGGWIGYMQTDQAEKPVPAAKAPTILPNDTVVALDHQPDSAPAQLTPAAKIADEVRIEESFRNSSGIAGNIAKVNPPIPVRTTAVTTNELPADVIQPVTDPVLEEETEQSPQSYADIPLRIKQTLPALKITLHFYNSIPEKRLVRINGKNLHEGDWLEDGLFVEEIKPAATVLNHAGFLFTLDAPGR